MEIVVRAAVVFVFLWVVTRVVGRSTLGELSTFPLLLYVTMGDLVQQAVTQQDSSLTSAVLAVSVFALLTIAVSGANTRWRRARPLVHGVPVVIVRAGEPLLDVMQRERMSADDLMAAARARGIRRLTEVDLAVLETNGKVSFFTPGGGDSGASEKPTVG